MVEVSPGVASTNTYEGARAAAHVEHGAHPAELQLFLDQVLGGGHRAVVLRLRVGLGDRRVGEPRRIRGGLTGGHHARQRTHAVVELATHLVAQVVTVVLLGGRDEEACRVGRDGVHAGQRAGQALDGDERGEQRLQPRGRDGRGILQP